MTSALQKTLNALASAAKAHGGWRLVARFDDEDVFRDGSGAVRVFVPDLHLLGAQDQSHYRYSFDHDEGPGWIARSPLLGDLVAALRDLGGRRGGGVELHQLGDYADVWRAYDDDGLRALEAILTRGDYPFLRTMADEALFVAGNHDQELTATALLRAEKSRLVGEADGAPAMLVTHGDALDPVENMGRLNRTAVRLLGEANAAATYDLRVPPEAALPGSVAAAAADPDEDPLVNVRVATWTKKFLREWTNTTDAAARTSARFRSVLDGLTEAHELLPLAFDARLRLGEAAGSPWRDVPTEAKRRLMRLGLEESPAGAPPNLIVVGHSHRARITVAEERDERDQPTGDRFVLMDCGAWIENAVFDDGTARGRFGPSCQIGVQAGSDLRIYQFDPRGGTP
jgi:hypothetical protein